MSTTSCLTALQQYLYLAKYILHVQHNGHEGWVNHVVDNCLLPWQCTTTLHYGKNSHLLLQKPSIFTWQLTKLLYIHAFLWELLFFFRFTFSSQSFIVTHNNSSNSYSRLITTRAFIAEQFTSTPGSEVPRNTTNNSVESTSTEEMLTHTGWLGDDESIVRCSGTK